MEEVADALRPESFEEFVGQEALKRQLSVMMASARRRNAPLDHVLLAGPPGFGKTSLAQVISTTMADPLLSFRMPVTTSSFERELTRWDGGVLFLDEIHMANEQIQTSLLTITEDKYMTTKQGRKVPQPWVTVIGATTEPERIVKPLRERFTCRPMLEDYSDDEMARIVRGMMRKCDMPVSDELAIPIAVGAAGIPRTAKRLVEGARDLWLDGDRVLPGAAEVLQFRQIQADGLDAEQMHYLECLHAIGGQAGLSTLSTILRLNEASIRDLERVLLKRGLVELSPQGRVITTAGVSRLGHGRRERKAAS